MTQWDGRHSCCKGETKVNESESWSEREKGSRERKVVWKVLLEVGIASNRKSGGYGE